MRDIDLPDGMRSLEIALRGIEDAILCWLALKTRGAIAHIGCDDGSRLMCMDRILRRLQRPMVGIDWSAEHRFNPKQKRITTTKHRLGSKCVKMDNFTAINADPGAVSYSDLQPIGMVIVDYDRSAAGLKRVCEPLLKELPILGVRNVIMAWTGFQPSYDEKTENEVWRYVSSLNLNDTFHFAGHDIAFKVFNMTPDFRNHLQAYAKH